MQRTDLQNERPLASSLLGHSRRPFSQNMLPTVAWTHPPHTGSGAEMQSENPERTGRDNAPQICCRGNGSYPSEEMLPLVKKIKVMGFSVLFLPGSLHHLDHALNILS